MEIRVVGRSAAFEEGYVLYDKFGEKELINYSIWNLSQYHEGPRGERVWIVSRTVLRYTFG